jgi:hypothetical protein
VVKNDASDHPELVKLVESLKEPICDISSSGVDSHSSKRAFQVRNSLN